MTLISSNQIRGACRKAEPAVHTRVQSRIAGACFSAHPLFGAFQCDAQALSWVEGAAEPAYDFSNALAIRSEMAQGTADGPGCTFQGHGDLACRRRSPQGTKAFQHRVTGPADHAVTRSGGHKSLVEVVRQKIERIVNAVTQNSQSKRHRPREASPGSRAP